MSQEVGMHLCNTIKHMHKSHRLDLYIPNQPLAAFPYVSAFPNTRDKINCMFKNITKYLIEKITKCNIYENFIFHTHFLNVYLYIK